MYKGRGKNHLDPVVIEKLLIIQSAVAFWWISSENMTFVSTLVHLGRLLLYGFQ